MVDVSDYVNKQVIIAALVSVVLAALLDAVGFNQFVNDVLSNQSDADSAEVGQVSETVEEDGFTADQFENDEP